MNTFKVDNEFLPYHPSASHVPPGYRDGWNHCFVMAKIRITDLEAQIADAKQAAKWESDLCEQALADMKKHEAQCKEAQRIAGDLFTEIKDPNSVAGDAYVEYFERVTGVSIESAAGIATANP
jgi:hypothetical protein